MKTAQQAYEETLKNNFSDTTPILENAEKNIQEAIKFGCFATVIGPYNVPIAEKAAIEMEKLGYSAIVMGSGRFTQNNEPLVNIQINWKHLPLNSRESYT